MTDKALYKRIVEADWMYLTALAKQADEKSPRRPKSVNKIVSVSKTLQHRIDDAKKKRHENQEWQ